MARLGSQTGVLEFLGGVWRSRELLQALTAREIGERFAGTALGWVWMLVQPTLQVAVYLFVFGTILAVRFEGDRSVPGSYGVYILSGLIPWLAFQDAITRATVSLSGNASLVRQVVFPVELLPLRVVLASVVPQLATFGLVLAWIVATTGSAPATVLLLPWLVVMQVGTVTGIALALSTIGVVVKDLRDAVQLLFFLGLYLTPILYLPEWVPARLQPALPFNPASHLVWCYQDALFHGAIVHPWSWLLLPALASTSLALGVRAFRTFQVLVVNHV